MSLTAGTRLGCYEIQSHLGSGGMGEVYRARDQRLGRQVALKFLPAGAVTNRAVVDHFFAEARAASALNHPNIVTVHEIEESPAGPFIVMELVQGQTLRTMMGHPNSLESVIELGRQVATALSVAHASGIFHRDIKPENIMVRQDGIVKLLDFGLARLISTVPLAADVETIERTGQAQLSAAFGTCLPSKRRERLSQPLRTSSHSDWSYTSSSRDSTHFKHSRQSEYWARSSLSLQSLHRGSRRGLHRPSMRCC